MGHLTEQIPKPMIRVNGKPLLEHILDQLRAAGIEQVAIVTGYLRESIEEYFEQYPVRISWLHQEVLNGTATAVRLARSFAGGDPFVLTFGDIWCDASDYRGLTAALDGDAAGVLGVRRVDDPWQGAAVYVRDDAVVRIVEKPEKGTSATHWNSAGVYAFRAVVFEYVDRVEKSTRGEYEITSAIEKMIEDGQKLKDYEIKGTWRDVGRPEDLAAIERSTR